MSRLIRNVSDIRNKIKNIRKTCENLSISSRRSSANYENSVLLQEIPKNTSELLRKYGSSRARIPSYKLDATNLMLSVILKPLQRLFTSLKKNSKPIRKTSQTLHHQVQKFEKHEKNFNQSRFSSQTRAPRSNRSQVFQVIEKIFNIFKKNLPIMKKFAIESIIIYVRKKYAVDVILKGILYKEKQILREVFKMIKKTRLYDNNSVLTTKVLPIPPLNLEKQVFSPYFPQILRKDSCSNSRILSENFSRDSKRSNVLTDRRSERMVNPSTLPSSIFSDSDNSVTDRSEIRNNSKKKIQSIQLKDIENFWDLDSMQECKKPVSKKNFFKQQEIRKHYSRALEKFAGNYELFSLEKIMKKYIEKVLIKGFYRWRFGVKKKRSFYNQSSRYTYRSIRKPFQILSTLFLRSSWHYTKSSLSKNFYISVKTLLKNISKDQTYRKNICFLHWKSSSQNFILSKLKSISLINNFNLVLNLRRSWAFHLLKHLNSKSLI